MKRKTIKKVVYYGVGTTLLSFGITLSILSQLGAGAFDAHNANLSEMINITVGQSMYLSLFVLYIITMILKPKKIYIVGLFLTGLVGLGVDTWMLIIPQIEQSMVMKLFYFTGAILILPLGIAFLIRSSLPLSPIDNLLVILIEKTKWPISILKSTMEGTFAVIALIYGMIAAIGLGSVSVGTIIITIAIGPAIEFYMRHIKEIEVVE